MNMNGTQTPDERALLKRSIALASSNLMLFAILTVVNMVLIAANANISFSFSAEIPPILFAYAVAAVTTDGLAAVGAILFILAILSVGFIFLCSVMSKKKAGWLIASLVYVIADLLLTLAIYIPLTAYGATAVSTLIFSTLFHAWMLYYIVKGISANSKLKKFPPEPMTYDVPFTTDGYSEGYMTNGGRTVGESDASQNDAQAFGENEASQNDKNERNGDMQ